MIRALHGELERSLATRILLLAPVAGLAIPFALTAGLILLGPENMNPPMPGIDTAAGLRGLLSVLLLTAPVPAIAGSRLMTAEHSHGTLVPTFLAEPRRWPVLVAKLVVAVLLGCVYGAGTAAGTLGGIALGSTLAHVEPALGAGALIVLACRIGAAMVMYTVLGVGIGALLRSPLITMAAIFVWFYFAESLLSGIPGAGLIYPFLPGGAASALVGHSLVLEAIAQTVGGTPPQLLAVGPAVLVLAAYTAVLAGLAVALPMRRDVR